MLALRSPVYRKRPNVVLPSGFNAEWDLEHLGGEQFILRRRTAITQTASDVTTLLSFPFHGKLLELMVYHYDASSVLSNDAMTLSIYSQDGTDWLINLRRDNSASSNFDVSYMDEGGRAFNPGLFRIVTNTTNGHLVKINARVEVLKG